MSNEEETKDGVIHGSCTIELKLGAGDEELTPAENEVLRRIDEQQAAEARADVAMGIIEGSCTIETR